MYIDFYSVQSGMFYFQEIFDRPRPILSLILMTTFSIVSSIGSQTVAFYH